jgi:hypothetical protein
MLTNSKIALSLALVLATVSAAVSAPKQTQFRQPIITAGSHLSLNSLPYTEPVRSTVKANQASNISQREFEGLAHLIEAIDEFGN